MSPHRRQSRGLHSVGKWACSQSHLWGCKETKSHITGEFRPVFILGVCTQVSYRSGFVSKTSSSFQDLAPSTGSSPATDSAVVISHNPRFAEFNLKAKCFNISYFQCRSFNSLSLFKTKVHLQQYNFRFRYIVLRHVFKISICQNPTSTCNHLPPSKKLQTLSSRLDTKWKVSRMICCCMSSACRKTCKTV